jgi:hypothetical protein
MSARTSIVSTTIRVGVLETRARGGIRKMTNTA